jgi:AAA family ATPase
VLIGATNRVDTVDPALRRPGRFDREIEVGVPSPADRCVILSKKLAGMAHVLTDTEVGSLAQSAHGFVAADLTALCSEAAVAALRRSRHGGSKGPAVVSLADFRIAQTRVPPTAMRELTLELPAVSWEDVGGLDDVKASLREAVEWPFTRKDALNKVGAKAPQGILLHGPPGCSKTLLARAVASQAGLNFISVKGADLFSKYMGESEKAVASLFARSDVRYYFFSSGGIQMS